MQAEQLELNAQVEDRHWWFVARRRIMRTLIEQVLPPQQGAVVVDVGCGTGGNIAALANDYRAIGIDTAEVAIRLAKRRYSDVEFICGHAPEDLGSLAGEAGLFLLMDVLEHVPDDFEMLTSLFARARPGTYFLLSVPANPHLWSHHDESHLHYRRYDRTRFSRLWRDLPVTELACSYFNSRLSFLIRGVRAIGHWRGRASGAAGTDLWVPGPMLNRALTATFAGESRRLVSAISGRGAGYTSGVSLLAVLRRDEGEIVPFGRPDDVAPDEHQPAVESFEPACA